MKTYVDCKTKSREIWQKKKDVYSKTAFIPFFYCHLFCLRLVISLWNWPLANLRALVHACPLLSFYKCICSSKNVISSFSTSINSFLEHLLYEKQWWTHTALNICEHGISHFCEYKRLFVKGTLWVDTTIVVKLHRLYVKHVYIK